VTTAPARTAPTVDTATTAPGGATPVAARSRVVVGPQLRRVLGGLVAGVVILIGAWEIATLTIHIPPLVFKSPASVGSYLVTGSGAAGHRSLVFAALGTTLRDALIGYLIGSALAMAVSCLFSLSVLAEGIVLPVAILLQSVPLLALAPLITIEFGRGLVSVTVITTVITFLPTLLTVTLGLRSCPPSSADLVQAYGGGRLFFLRHVAIPSAVPSMFAAMRLAAPTSLIGALLAEYLATGNGVGDILATSQTTYDYGEIWSAVALIGICGLLLYAVVSLIEIPILARFDAADFEV
jgi:ABC-type nitrate/sulfonate/bicarbonate transport system permease component